MKINYITSFAAVAAALTISLANANEQVNSTSDSVITEQQSPNVKTILMDKLANLNYFSANFVQEVFSESGEKLEQSAGKLAISKPNLANWHTIEPDELTIISDSSDVWFYNPWIEQVSVYSLSAAIAKTPILLLTSKDKALWQQYTVTKLIPAKDVEHLTQTDESFVISAIDVNSQIKSLTLTFDTSTETGNLTQFSFLDATGQLSHIHLSNYDDESEPEAGLFNFTVPEGVQVDDQRTNEDE
jgi:outer membrane lipoprotein carrier protein